MSYESEISVYLDDYGYDLEFKAEDNDGNIVDLIGVSGASGFCLRTYLDTSSGLRLMWYDCVSGHFTIANMSGGLFRWEVPSGWFNRKGIYETKCNVRYSGMKYITLDDLRTNVIEAGV